jgi:hypothetical protein
MSIDYPELPVAKGLVRGTIIISGTELTKVDDNKTKITYVGLYLNF